MLLDDDKVRERALSIMRLEGTKIEKLIKAAMALVSDKQHTPSARFLAVGDIADKLSKIVAPHTPCASGCSHCCYMAVAVSSVEAETIGRYLGRKPVAQGTFDGTTVQRLEANVQKYTAKPCTLLVDGKCSVYPVRPIACRTHHNLNSDSSNCVIKEGLVDMETTPALDFSIVSGSAVEIAVQMKAGFADIRDFFP